MIRLDEVDLNQVCVSDMELLCKEMKIIIPFDLYESQIRSGWVYLYLTSLGAEMIRKLEFLLKKNFTFISCLYMENERCRFGKSCYYNNFSRTPYVRTLILYYPAPGKVTLSTRIIEISDLAWDKFREFTTLGFPIEVRFEILKYYLAFW
jgi:hypothetical protein